MSTKLIDITKQLKIFFPSAAETMLLKETNGLTGDSIIEVHIKKQWQDSGNSITRFFPGTPVNEKTNCINIVNVGVAEKNRRKGLFTDFLELLENFDYGSCFNKSLPFYIRVDKVMNPVLDEFLPKKGYVPMRAVNEPHYSYLKKIRAADVDENLDCIEVDNQVPFHGIMADANNFALSDMTFSGKQP